MAYSDPPLRNMVRLIVTSAYSIGSAPSELSMVSTTSARPSGGRPDVPAKMTSSILPPRSDLAPCSPMTQASASTTLDLPEPLGPTMQVIPGSSWSVVEEAKDLNPFRVRLFRYNAGSQRSIGIEVLIRTLHPSQPAVGEAQRGSRYPEPPPIGGIRAAVSAQAIAGSAASSACAMWESWPQISTTKTAEPTKANQNGAVTPQCWASTPPTPGADDQAAVDADQVDAADPALELGGHRALPDRERGGAPDERVRAEDEEDAHRDPGGRWSAPARSIVKVSKTRPTRIRLPRLTRRVIQP